MGARIDKYFNPCFSWWVSLTARECKLTIRCVDFKTFDVAVLGPEEGRDRFKNEYDRAFNNTGNDILKYLMGV